ncbi:MAG: hypothetical protein K0S56_3538 [Microvirga sp.]|nr:hypothetical protein [Microvirga sp.]
MSAFAPSSAGRRPGSQPARNFVLLETRALGKTFAIGGRQIVALADVDLALARGSFTVIIGRSGCGKSTLLRVVAGLTEPTSGTIRYAHGKRPTIGSVFQEPRLMPWLNVEANIAFGLVGKLPQSEIDERVTEVLDLVGLKAFRDAQPDQLSGGMASRVGLARALAMKPDILLFDEPFAALDAFTRRNLQQELSAIWRARQPTILFVTHDVEEAVVLGDVILHMSEGRVVDRIPVPLAHPREPTDSDVVSIRSRVLHRLAAPTAFHHGNVVPLQPPVSIAVPKEKIS